MFAYDMIMHTVDKEINLISALVNLKYSYDDEIALLSKGIFDNTDIEFIEYRNYVSEIKMFVKGVK